ncbi:hypothetical protein CIK06_18670 [Plantactinospora sp. KBS50]|nr:hypothetical protein CIK06_18670 [Plantactinospora sp. KBS50]
MFAPGAALFSLHLRIVRIFAQLFEALVAFDSGVDILKCGVAPAEHGQANRRSVQQLVAVAQVEAVVPGPLQPPVVAEPSIRRGDLRPARVLRGTSTSCRLLLSTSHRAFRCQITRNHRSVIASMVCTCSGCKSRASA